MGKYVLVSLGCGILFGILDGVINANPFAQKLFAVFSPILKKSVNAPAGLIIDLVYGFIMTAVFLLLFNGLPGSSGILKGLSFGLLVWFFRVVMYAASIWMMFEIPTSLVVYTLLTGLGEMLLLGLFYGLTLKPG
jgi:hypothetical protein